MVEQNVNILIITKVFCERFLCAMHIVQKYGENFVEVYKVIFFARKIAKNSQDLCVMQFLQKDC